MTTTTLTRFARTAAAVLLTAATAATPVHAAATPPPMSGGFELPQPTGPYAVGRDVLHLVDRARQDPWVPANPRELMVSMYYPATAATGRPARYLTTTEARMILDDRGLTGVIEPAAVSATRTHARAGAHPRPGRHPLVLLSPGFTLHRHTLTNLAEDLASRGYVVAAVDHAYESAGTAFPGGRVLDCVACTESAGDIARVATGRAQDLTFLLNRLTGAHPAWSHAKLIDRRRVGLAGHSIGGNAASATMAADPRVRAGVNMDGTFFAPVPATGLTGRPFLLLGAPKHSPGGTDQTWDRDWRRLDGWKRWLTVTGTAHLSFTDLPVLGQQAGLPDAEAPLPGDRTALLVREYVGAFFDRHLRGRPRPLLDGPSAGRPEVVFHRP